MLLAALAVATGAALGALLRWALGVGLNHLFPRLPPGTLVANLVGCFAVGLVAPSLLAGSAGVEVWRAFAVVGVLGGLTTFSTFSAEIVQRLRDGHAGWAAAGVAAHLLGSLAATFAGFAIAAALNAAPGA
ncbi:MAG: fluoride efflux transporter CrcB [Rubrivivax sp.]|nr:fluoride efflux transporter CrcB [Rubrivivax sp.]